MKKIANRMLVLGMLLAVLPAFSRAEEISPRRLLEVVDFGSPVVSPDGTSVAFRVEQASIERNTYDSYWYVQTNWIDLNGAALQQMQPVPVPESLVQVFGMQNFYPELGQSISSALQVEIDRLPRQIVGLMETPS